MAMKTSGRSIAHCGTRVVASIVGLSLTLGTLVHAVGAVCVGDCHNSGEVSVTDIIALVNIALGSLDNSACPSDLPSDSPTVSVRLIIQAVNNALNGCGGSTVCGDGHVDPREECDDGGTCIGGTNAGTACTADGQCAGEGVCVGGSNELTACAGDAACSGGTCIKCKAFGGDGCAANCTLESTVPFDFVPGIGIAKGTSGAVVHGEALTVRLSISGGAAVTIGKARDGIIPMVMKATALRIPAIPLRSLSCSCVRGVARKTCGGTLYEADGMPSTDCTPGFTAGDGVCAGKKPCASMMGDGNAWIGRGGCTAGALADIDVSVTQDSGGSSHPVSLPLITFSGGPAAAGAALLFESFAIGYIQGTCSGTTLAYGQDGELCTDDDPYFARGTPITELITTGVITGAVINANAIDAVDIGPFSVTGQPLNCATPLNPFAGATLASTFTALNVALLGDTVVASLQGSSLPRYGATAPRSTQSTASPTHYGGSWRRTPRPQSWAQPARN